MAVKDKGRVILLMKYWLPVILCMGAIFYFSSLTGNDIPSIFPLQDIFFHGIIYAVLGLLLRRALNNSLAQKKPLTLLLFAVLLGSLYGLSDEFHQSFIPGRNASLADWLIDTAGTFAGSLILR